MATVCTSLSPYTGLMTIVERPMSCVPRISSHAIGNGCAPWAIAQGAAPFGSIAGGGATPIVQRAVG
ncbi:hypothetical protein [Scytonema sp. HK-05]|uniref:hypothetical protein n=1 Tax=Scytonema sp. HK-05 TaxID=1137095 RepID=UPI001160F936|nr:hypothetical protein [Scytonema sp. HK-05]